MKLIKLIIGVFLLFVLFFILFCFYVVKTYHPRIEYIDDGATVKGLLNG